MLWLQSLIVSQCLTTVCRLGLSSALLTTFPIGNQWGRDPTLHGECEGGFPDKLYFDNKTTFEYKPKPASANRTSVAWKSYGKSRPQVVVTSCEFTRVSGVAFATRNVKSSGVIVNEDSFYGAVDQFGKVEVETGFTDLSQSMAGWVIKITLTPKNYSLPVELNSLEIRICSTYYDCFAACAIYVLDPATGCKKPRCMAEDPCSLLFCSDGEECRLIVGEDKSTFPSVMTAGVQLWGCVDPNRTDYGCTCSGKYGIDENQCPTCSCDEGSATTLKTWTP